MRLILEMYLQFGFFCFFFITSTLVGVNSFDQTKWKQQSAVSVLLGLDSEPQKVENFAPKEKVSVQELFFNQKLVHEPITAQLLGVSSKTWKQRYFMDKTYWNGSDGPVFLLFGGESALSMESLQNLAITDYAKQFNALLLALEHRYYGISMPTNCSTENLERYLSSRIALQDAAYFVDSMKTQLETNSSFVSFGGSYPGALAAWSRLKYPQQFSAAVSSSGPVLAVYNFYQYLDVVTESLKYYGGHACTDAVRTAFFALERKLLSMDPNIHSEIMSEFRVCKNTNLSNHLDRFQFVNTLVSYFQGTVQYNSNKLNTTVKDVCLIMTDSKFPDAYSAFQSLVERYSLSDSCVNGSWYEMIQLLQNELPSSQDMMRQWTFQTCNEFGYFQTTDSPRPGIFGTLMPVSYSQEICRLAFGKDFATSENVKATNFYYGGNDSVSQSNIMFINGEIDPWHSLGVVQENSHIPQFSQLVVLLKEGSHCENMKISTRKESSELHLVKKLIATTLKNWISP
eukprot:Sdes_comp9605_c0_seq1m1091